jgi:hypothetical protein
MEYAFWEIHYTSCEGNKRWTTARAPADWEEYQVRERIPMGGCGDDVAQINEVFQTFEGHIYTWDFCD